MKNYIDGFAFPIRKSHLPSYEKIVHEVAMIWKESGALSYQEYVSDSLKLEGTLSFTNLLNAQDDECIIFGWLEFESREKRDIAHKQVASDSKMNELVAPLFESKHPIFDPSRMAFGGFSHLVAL